MYFISKRAVPMKTSSFDVYDITLGNPDDPVDTHVKMGSACIDTQTRVVRGLFIEDDYRGWGYAGRLLDQIFLDHPDAFINVPKDACIAMTLEHVVAWLQRRGMYIVNVTDDYILLAPIKDNVRILQ